MLQYQAETVEIVPITLSQKRSGETPLVPLAALEQDFQGGVVVGFNDVVCRFLVVRIGAAFE
jgi:hypothetical protein